MKESSTEKSPLTANESGGVGGMSEKLEMYLKIAKAQTFEEAVQYMKKACPGITDEEAKKRVMNIFNM